MSSLKSNWQRKNLLIESKKVEEILFLDLDSKPNAFYIQNNSSSTLYISFSSTPTSTNFEFKIGAKKAQPFGRPMTTDRMYIYNDSNVQASIIMYSDTQDFNLSDLAQITVDISEEITNQITANFEAYAFPYDNENVWVKVVGLLNDLLSDTDNLNTFNSKLTDIINSLTTVLNRLSVSATYNTDIQNLITEIKSKATDIVTKLTTSNNNDNDIKSLITAIKSNAIDMVTKLDTSNTNDDTRLSILNSILSKIPTSIDASGASITIDLTSVETALTSVLSDNTEVKNTLSNINNLLTTLNTTMSGGEITFPVAIDTNNISRLYLAMERFFMVHDPIATSNHTTNIVQLRYDVTLSYTWVRNPSEGTSVQHNFVSIKNDTDAIAYLMLNDNSYIVNDITESNNTNIITSTTKALASKYYYIMPDTVFSVYIGEIAQYCVGLSEHPGDKLDTTPSKGYITIFQEWR